MQEMINDDLCYLDEIIIQGITNKGSKFRPGDWVDRLCGMLASFEANQRMAYSPYLRPMVFKGMNCVAVKKSLEQQNKKVFDFVMKFAQDNNLVVVTCTELKQQI